MNVILAEDLTVRKDRNRILDHLTLRVKGGTITGLIGPSGSGKTTLMRAIVGVQKYDGVLAVLDQPAGARRLRTKIGYVTQSPAVYGDLTVWQNIVYFATIVGAKKNKAREVLKQVQLDKYAGQIVNLLSGGQRARVSLAVALLGDPEILVLDEPTVGLDPILRNELWEQFAKLAADGKTLLISSHVMDEADRCNDLILIRDGAVMWNDTKVKLLAQTHAKSVGDAFVAMIREDK